MTLRLLRPLIAFSLLLTLLNSTIFACGPFSMEAVFVYTVHPAYPLERYAKGEIGVVQPSYARSYLYVAYRHLSNSPFTPEEQKALTELWSDRLNNTWDLGEQDWIKAWNDARQKVPGVTQPPKIDVYRNREKPNEYETYLNCQKDAFETAISTLNDRVQKYGVDNPTVRTWVEGQDLVFANCSEGKQIPSQLATDARWRVLIVLIKLPRRTFTRVALTRLKKSLPLSPRTPVHHGERLRRTYWRGHFCARPVSVPRKQRTRHSARLKLS